MIFLGMSTSFKKKIDKAKLSWNIVELFMNKVIICMKFNDNLNKIQ